MKMIDLLIFRFYRGEENDDNYYIKNPDNYFVKGELPQVE